MTPGDNGQVEEPLDGRDESGRLLSGEGASERARAAARARWDRPKETAGADEWSLLVDAVVSATVEEGEDERPLRTLVNQSVELVKSGSPAVRLKALGQLIEALRPGGVVAARPIELSLAPGPARQLSAALAAASGGRLIVSDKVLTLRLAPEEVLRVDTAGAISAT